MTAPSLHSISDIASLPAEVRDDLRAYAELGGFTVTTDTHAWYAAVDTVAGPEEARAASTALAELRGRDLPTLSAAARSLAEAEALGIDAPRTVAESSRAVALLRRVRLTLRTLTPETYDVADAELAELVAATASAAWRRERGVKVTWLRRRALRGRVRALATGRARRDAVHAALASAATERTDWAALGGAGRPAVPADADFLDEASRAAEAAVAGLGELGRLLRPEAALDTLPFEELAELLDRLAADEGTLYRLPNLRAIRARLEEQGLGAVLAELTERRVDAAEVVALLGEAETAVVPEPRTASEPEAAVAAEGEGEAVAGAEAVEPGPVVEVAEPEPVADELVAEVPVAEAEPVVGPESAAVVEVASVVAESVGVPPAVDEVGSGEAVSAAPEFGAEEAVAEVPVAEAEPVAEVAAEVSAPGAEVVEREPGPVVEAVVVEAEVAEPEPGPVVEAVVVEAEVAEPEPVADELVAEVPVAEAEPVVGPESVPVVEAELVVAESVVDEPVAEVTAEVSAPGQAVEAVVVEAEVAEPEPVAEVPVAEAESVAEPESAAVVGAESAVAEAEPVVEVPAEEAGGRPGKPSITPGKAVTAYSAEELTALVRWIDGDGEKRSDDELLRAAMKELGFARLGPRIKEALGAAVAEVRA